jgi:hypothetical protein
MFNLQPLRHISTLPSLITLWKSEASAVPGPPCRGFLFSRSSSGANLTLGSRASAVNPAEIRHYRRTQAYDFHH